MKALLIKRSVFRSFALNSWIEMLIAFIIML